jgi:uncharacterized membrane protein YkoI
MTISRTILITMAAAAVFSLAAAMPASAQGRAGDNLECLTDRQIQVAIESGQILSWPKVKRLAGISAYEEVSDVEVCMIDGVPYYILNVVSPEGEAAKIALNAVDGTEEVL